MKKTKKEKRVKKKNGIIFIVICLILVLSYFILNKKIDCIYVLNNNYLKESDILSLAGLDNYPKVYQVSTSKIRKRSLSKLLGSYVISDILFITSFFINTYLSTKGLKICSDNWFVKTGKPNIFLETKTFSLLESITLLSNS